jgi:hypothetical protein
MPAVRMKFRPEKRAAGCFRSLEEFLWQRRLEGTSQDTLLNSTSRLVLRWLASKSMPACADGGARVHGGQLADHRVGGVNARLGFCGAGLGAAAKPLDLGFDLVAQALLLAALRFQIGLLFFKKAAEVSFHAQEAVGKDAIQLDDLA